MTDLQKLMSRDVTFTKITEHSAKALCPFHEERTPSLSINKTKNYYYCFGCGATGKA